MTIDKYGGVHFTFVVTEQVKNIIKERSEAEGISQTDYILKAALNIRIPDSSALKAIRKPIKTTEYKLAAKKFVADLKNNTTQREDNDMNKKNGASKKTAQFHLRVTPESYATIQKKADEMAMSVSDYVEFVISKYDIEEVSMKMDKVLGMKTDLDSIMQRLDKLENKASEDVNGV